MAVENRWPYQGDVFVFESPSLSNNISILNCIIFVDW